MLLAEPISAAVALLLGLQGGVRGFATGPQIHNQKFLIIIFRVAQKKYNYKKSIT
jgi:hypothetical protein